MLLGIDIGGTSIHYGVVDHKKDIIYRGRIVTQDYKDPMDALQAIYDDIEKNKMIDKIKGVGIGAPNARFKKGIIDNAPNLQWLGIIGFNKMVEKIFNVKAIIDNDANIAAYGELIYGNGKDYDHFVQLTLGTGLGAGIIIDRKIFRGATDVAGELGHSIIEKNGRQCNCGKKGCLETYVSTKGMWQTAQEITKNHSESVLQANEFYPDFAYKIYEEAQKGNHKALKIYDLTADHLALGIANLNQVLGTQAIILSGGLANAKEYILKPLKKALKKYAQPLFLDSLNLEMTACDQGKIIILGATTLWEDFHES